MMSQFSFTFINRKINYENADDACVIYFYSPRENRATLAGEKLKHFSMIYENISK